MSARKIVVPDGMLHAALHAKEMPQTYPFMNTVRPALEAALQWLSENPIVPTDEQNDELLHCWTDNAHNIERDAEGRVMYPRVIAVEWQRRMFLAPPETLPSELIDLIYGKNTWTPADVLEAFRRGQKSGAR